MIDRQNKKFGIDTVSAHGRRQSTLGNVMRKIIESGMIYTVLSIFTLATYMVQSTVHYPASALVSCIQSIGRWFLSHPAWQEIHSVGITFNLILIRGTRTTQPQPGTSVFRFSQTRTQETTLGAESNISDHFVLSRLDKESSGTGIEAIK
jgi:hypothetical protein